MKQLIPMNEFGLMAGKDYVARVDSRMVAEAFEKQHKNVLQTIHQITGGESGYSKEFTELNFQPSKYVDETGRKLPCYLLTRDGFVALAMGFSSLKERSQIWTLSVPNNLRRPLSRRIGDDFTMLVMGYTVESEAKPYERTEHYGGRDFDERISSISE